MIHSLIELALAAAEWPDADFDLGVAAVSVVEQSDLAESGFDRGLLVARAVALVGEVMRSPVWRRLGAGTARRVEVPFTIAVHPAEIPPGVETDYGPGDGRSAAAGRVPVLVRGQIDLVFRDASAPPPAGMSDWLVVDWKTTSAIAADRGRLAEHYRPQLRLYARCWATPGPEAADDPTGTRSL